jgi:hypothetical protein
LAKTKWEYTILEFGILEVRLKEEILNKLGVERWELVSSTTYIGSGGGIFSTYVLKREL